MKIFCCECKTEVAARLINGREAYPHRPDLAALPFWKCDNCGNRVGCHHKTADKTKPLGCITNAAMRNARKHIHALIDPVWLSGQVSREEIYQHISNKTGKTYHTASIRTIEEARNVYRIARDFIREINKQR